MRIKLYRKETIIVLNIFHGTGIISYKFNSMLKVYENNRDMLLNQMVMEMQIANRKKLAISHV